MKQCYGMAVCAAVIIIISTVTVSTAIADTATLGYSNSNKGFSSHFVSGGGAEEDHEDFTNPNIYDGKREIRAFVTLAHEADGDDLLKVGA